MNVTTTVCWNEWSNLVVAWNVWNKQLNNIYNGTYANAISIAVGWLVGYLNTVTGGGIEQSVKTFYWEIV